MLRIHKFNEQARDALHSVTLLSADNADAVLLLTNLKQSPTVADLQRLKQYALGMHSLMVIIHFLSFFLPVLTHCFIIDYLMFSATGKWVYHRGSGNAATSQLLFDNEGNSDATHSKLFYELEFGT